MRQLNYDLKHVQDDHPENAHGTRTRCSMVLVHMADTLHELGFRHVRATGLGGKHIEALVAEWKRRRQSFGTMPSRMTALRWWTRKIGKPNIVRKDNASYGFGRRTEPPCPVFLSDPVRGPRMRNRMAWHRRRRNERTRRAWAVVNGAGSASPSR